ncbi:uncharacterized protein [Nicotiana tomentosiformis]|uniref:uncharacterized protein n=1 Tax=Nicotiana tomentosiformis TaxID=4098 RepID=UPI00388C7BA4
MSGLQSVEAFPYVVIDILTVQSHDMFALIDPDFTLSFVTPYVAMEFGIEQEQLHEPFFVSTLVGESIMARGFIEIVLSWYVIGTMDELLKDYDIDILYHPGKANVVAYALSQKSMGSFAHLEAYQRPLDREVHWLASLGVRRVDSSEGGVIVQNRAESLLMVEVKVKQYDDPLMVQLKERIHKHKTTTVSLGMDDGTLRYQGQLCVTNIDGLRERVMAETHTSRYSVHPSSTNMYNDLKEVYWWNYMKRNVADFVGKCPNCSIISDREEQFTANFCKIVQEGLGTQVNLSTSFYLETNRQAERTIHTLEDMPRACVLDFKGSSANNLPFIEFSYNNIYHASIQMEPFDVLYGRRCRSPIG